MSDTGGLPYETLSVADRFLQRGLANGKQDMTNMKLNKLVYIAHGWHLARLYRPLVDELPQVWTYGPVFPSLYYWIKFTKETANPDSPATKPDFFKKYSRYSLGEPQEKILDQVAARYLDMRGIDLAELTHGSVFDHTPWARTKHLGLTCIPDEFTREYYSDMLMYS